MVCFGVFLFYNKITPASIFFSAGTDFQKFMEYLCSRSGMCAIIALSIKNWESTPGKCAGRQRAMMNKIIVNIGGREYVMVAAENEEYVRKCAELVDQQLREVMADSRLAKADGAVLAAMNIADQLMKERETADDLRRQVKENLEEANSLKLELSEAKREIFKLGTKK